MKKQILITIGREYGSGGHDLAVLLGQRLGIRMLDRELIDELWKNDQEMKRLAQEYDERPVNRILSRKINEYDNSIPHNAAQRQFDMIRQIADSGESAIFVGRCADYVYLTAEDPGYEDPVGICREMAGYIAETHDRYIILPDRAAAVERAIAELAPGEILILAGKGEEDYQKVQGRYDFYESDLAIARRCLGV